jgi:hypothetical protein
LIFLKVRSRFLQSYIQPFDLHFSKFLYLFYLCTNVPNHTFKQLELFLSLLLISLEFIGCILDGGLEPGKVFLAVLLVTQKLGFMQVFQA